MFMPQWRLTNQFIALGPASTPDRNARVLSRRQWQQPTNVFSVLIPIHSSDVTLDRQGLYGV